MKLHALTAALLLAVTGAAQATTTFSDDFELNGVLGTDLNPAGWTGNALSDVLNDSQFEGNLCNGSGICVDLDNGATISYSLALTQDVEYTLSFWIAGNRRGQGTESVTVTFGDQTLNLTLANDAPGAAYDTSNMLMFTPLATANYSFSFTNTGAGGDVFGAMIDNVTVTAVPEPETFALLAAGLGFVGFVARRRSPR